MRLAVLLTLLGLAAPVSAEPTCNDEGAAREAFLEARSLAEQRQLSAARDQYARSLEACARVPTAYNLAVVQLQLGMPLEAERTASDILSGDFGPLEDSAREAVEALLGRARAAVGTLVLAAGDAPEGTTVSVDGGDARAVPVGETLAVRANPGDHRLVLRAPDGRSAQTVAHARAGEERPVTLTLPPMLVTEGDDRGPRRRRIWIGVAVAVVALAAGVTATVLLTRPEDPVEDPVWGRAELPLIAF